MTMWCRASTFVAVALFPFSLAEAQTVWIEAGGGYAAGKTDAAAGSDVLSGLQPGDYWQPLEATEGYRILVGDYAGLWTNLDLTLHSGAWPTDGGHYHSGWGFGSWNSYTCNTGDDGRQCVLDYTSGPAAARIQLEAEFSYGG